MEATNPTEIVKSVLVAIVRHLLSILAAYLISKGLISSDTLSEGNIAILGTGIVAALTSLAWIIINRLKTKNLVRAALEAPVGTGIEIVKADAAAKPLLEGVKL